MDLTATLLSVWGFFTGTILPFLFVLTIIVFIHEMGHFLVARWNKVKVDAFAIGFGPELAGFYDKRGTRWKLCAIPLGGYVKFFGDEDPTSKPDHEKLERMSADEREGAFEHKALWRRASIVAAGPAANFILTIVIYTGLFMMNDTIRIAPVVGELVEGSAAVEAGFQPGDRVLTINGDPVVSFEDISDVTMFNSGEPIAFTVERNGETLDIVAEPRMTDLTDQFGNAYRVARVGITSRSAPEDLSTYTLGPVDAVVKAGERTWLVVKGTLIFIKELILGRQDAKELRGPIGIGQVTSQVATLGIAQLLSLAAVISVSIGLLNLFPIPMLDGGHLLFYAIEAVRGRAMSPRSMDIAYKIGLACVLGLMLFATTNDIGRLFG